MPSVTEELPPLPPGKKRRRDDENLTADLGKTGLERPRISTYASPSSGPVGTAGHHWTNSRQQDTIFVDINNTALDRWQIHTSQPLQALPSVSRKIIPMPSAKRARLQDGEHDTRHRSWGVRSPPSTTRMLQDYTSAANRRPTSTPPLRPCHVCHRRPTKKSDLDSFADCQGCGERTCFVCLRECQGWMPEQKGGMSGDNDDASVLSEQEHEALSRSFHMEDVPNEAQDRDEGARDERRDDRGRDGWSAGGHRQVVCSRCCIEKGTDGDIVCLGCLSLMEGV